MTIIQLLGTICFLSLLLGCEYIPKPPTATELSAQASALRAGVDEGDKSIRGRFVTRFQITHGRARHTYFVIDTGTGPVLIALGSASTPDPQPGDLIVAAGERPARAEGVTIEASSVAIIWQRNAARPLTVDDLALEHYLADSSDVSAPHWGQLWDIPTSAAAFNRELSATSDPPGFPAFPLPPPKPYSHEVIPRRYWSDLAEPMTLGGVDTVLAAALRQCGYGSFAYFRVPGGFALVTPVERITADGGPFEKDRWADEVEPIDGFDLRQYIVSLLTANSGRFRVIVFLVTDRDVHPDDTPASPEEIKTWTESGGSALPVGVQQAPVTEEHRVTALVYLFEQAAKGRVPEVVKRTEPARKHLEAAGIWGKLEAP